MKEEISQPRINRRDLLKIGVGATAAPALLHRSGQGAGAKERPNVLLLMVDQYRGDCVGADGNRVIRTPNIDSLAREGVLFRRAYTSVPSCTPARSGLLTGLSPWHHGMLGYGRMADRYPIEKARSMSEAGYYAMGIGKMHYHPQRHLHGYHKILLDESGRAEAPGFKSDYRRWFAEQAPDLDPDATGIGWNDYRSAVYALPERLHPTRWTGETAVRFLKEYDKKQPFFLKVSFARPHSPYDPPERFMKMYAEADLPKAVVGKWAERYAKRSGKGYSIWHGDLGAEQVRRSRQGYYGSISFIDEEVGRILETLNDRGWLDETLIVFTADHGDMTGDHHMWRKTYAYEASARIPMLMRWPSGMGAAQHGQVSMAPVELRDVLPTFLEAASAPGAETLDGRSMLSLVRDRKTKWREFIDLEHDVCYSPANHWNALTDGLWKYIYHARDGEEQLFDLNADPGELNDLASVAAHQGELRKWRGRMVAHFEERGEEFVKDGKLVPRPKRRLYSPHYPGARG